MSGKRFGRLRESAGYTLVEALTVVGAMGVVAAVTAPSVIRFKATQEVQAATSQVGGMLQKVRARAIADATPYLVLFQREDVVAGERSAFALIVRDNDRSYSLTPPDDVENFSLDAELRPEIRQYGEAPGAPIYDDMVPPVEDRSPRVLLGLTTLSTSLSGSGSSGSGSGGLLGGTTTLMSSLLATSSGSSSTSGTATLSTEPVSSSVTNGTTFAVSSDAGVPAIAFNERGIPVSPDSPQEWGTGAGAVYLTDNANAVYAAVLSPLGEVSLGKYDAANGLWTK